MINPFCKSLGGFFGQLVYYGILKEEDAQCLKTDISIDPNFYLLFVSALVLVVLNTFVMNAVAHYFHDIESAKTFDANRKAYDLEDLGTWEENDDRNEDTRSNILPIEVRYTDRFRWLLHREDAMLSYITRPDDAAPSGTAIFDLSPPSSVAYQPNRVSQFLDEDDAESDLVTLPFESEIIVDTSNDRSLLTDDDNQFNTLPAGTNTAYDFADINDAQFDNILDELSVGESGIFTTDSFDATTKDVRTRDID